MVKVSEWVMKRFLVLTTLLELCFCHFIFQLPEDHVSKIVRQTVVDLNLKSSLWKRAI